MDRDDTSRWDRLAGTDGTALLDRLAGADRSGDAALRLGTALRREYDAGLVADAMTLTELRDRASAKFTLAGRMWFTRDGLEQASSEVLARHRAARFAGRDRVADLCCGIGGDLVALAVAGHEVTGVDLDPTHLWMAGRNATAHGAAVRTVRADVRDADLSGVDGVFVDPARRSAGGRMRTGDSEPPLGWCLDLAGRTGAAGIKAAPGIDHGTVPPEWELEFLALGRELKESALWSPALAGARTRATVFDPAGTHTIAGDPDPADGDTGVAVGPPGAWLLDPNPAVTRAGLVSQLARRTATTRIDPRIAFLTTDDEPAPTPFARVLRVLDSRPWDQKRLPRLLRELDVGAVDVRRRGLAGDVEALARTLRGRGSRHATVVMTRVDDRPWGLVCVAP
ncbi:class I SAM-dependent methyltransferase [Pseudonocardia sp. HH130630-07]|uniref:class I SAM-dependent methyltransferase n=1 Tax=Pseudonocardia sp. HH130630-07 TaxID=1690815 RepID=UPI000839B3A6|nr:class I SAM-dependent methyltransferase [Pseudonocardia sp. HH130630-07]